MLIKFYREKTKSMKDKHAEDTDRFSITIDEENSSNNIDLLGITLHSHNNEIDLKKYAIGLEMLNENPSPTGKVVYEFLKKVSCYYGNETQITAITRDNTGPTNFMVKSLSMTRVLTLFISKQALSVEGILKPYDRVHFELLDLRKDDNLKISRNSTAR